MNGIYRCFIMFSCLRSWIVNGLRLVCFLPLLSAISALQAQTASSLDHFVWSTPPPTVQAGQSIAAVVQARSLDNNPVPTFNGSAMVAALVPAQEPKLLITEIETINTQRVELSNFSANGIDIGGWRIVFYDSTSWPAPKASFTIPAGTVCAGRSVIEIRGSGYYPGAYPVFFTGFRPSWSNFSPLAVLLLNGDGKAVDFFCAANAYPPLIAVPTTITDTLWTGLPVAPNINSLRTYQRGGHADHNNAADWAANTNSFGTINLALQLPFVSPDSALAVLPSMISFTNGEWSGTLAIPIGATNAILRADDGNGHSGDSASFNVLPMPGLEVHVPHEAYKATPGLVGQGTAGIPQPLPSDLIVTLSSSKTNQVVIPPSVTITSGQTNASFGVTNLDTGLLEGPQTVTILATASGYSLASDVITNFDRQVPVLSVSVPATAFEGSLLPLTGQIRFSDPAAVPISVVCDLHCDRLPWVDYRVPSAYARQRAWQAGDLYGISSVQPWLSRCRADCRSVLSCSPLNEEA